MPIEMSLKILKKSNTFGHFLFKITKFSRAMLMPRSHESMLNKSDDRKNRVRYY